jgi:hypothetical protein
LESYKGVWRVQMACQGANRCTVGINGLPGELPGRAETLGPADFGPKCSLHMESWEFPVGSFLGGLLN